MDLSGRSKPGGLNAQQRLSVFSKPTPGAGVLKPKPPLKAINTPAARAQSAPSAAPRAAAPQASTPYSGGGGGGAQAFSASAAPAAPEPPQISDADWLAGDSGYQAQLAALLRALSDYDTDATAQKTKYNTDYGDAVKQLGFRQDDPATADNVGGWNFNDLNTASGRSFNNTQNDFAGRGLLQSSLYGTAVDNLTRSLNDQLGSVNNAKTSFLDELARGQASFKNENTMNQQQARAEALARRASTFGMQ